MRWKNQRLRENKQQIYPNIVTERKLKYCFQKVLGVYIYNHQYIGHNVALNQWYFFQYYFNYKTQYSTYFLERIRPHMFELGEHEKKFLSMRLQK